jgi:hypothetical protein
MKKSRFNLKYFFLLLTYFCLTSPIHSEIMILSKCKSFKDSFVKNEYILDFEKSLMIRNYIYDNKTYKKYRITDLSIKKENSIEKFIYEENEFILTDKMGYPQFYTQLVFKKNNPVINVKTVINNEPAISRLSTCGKVEIFEKES